MIEIIVASIGLLGVIVTVIVTANTTRDTVAKQLQTNQAVTSNEIAHIKGEMTEMKEDIKAHNNYAKLFNENIPVIKEQIKEANRRLDSLEKK